MVNQSVLITELININFSEDKTVMKPQNYTCTIISTWEECAKAVLVSVRSSSSLEAKPEPRPPRAYAARA